MEIVRGTLIRGGAGRFTPHSTWSVKRWGRLMEFNNEPFTDPADFLPAIFLEQETENRHGIGNPVQRGPTSGFLQINYSIVIFARVPFCRNVPAQ